MDSLIGKTIGRYKIVELLGRGGMAEVYKAYQASLDRYVAVKLMHTFLAEDPDFFNRFDREAKNVAALRHPHIIQIHDFDHEGEIYYMVMEFIDGGTLKDLLETLATQGERLPLNEALRIVKDIGSALTYSHSRGMIHRDIKPANVMIDSSGRVVLTDFGIAKMLTGTKYTASGSIMGTPTYMAPEQGLGKPGDERADIYSLGVMLYQLATGRLPFEADTPIAVILKHINDPLPPPRTINPDLPQGVERIIMKAMAKDVGQRYQKVSEMVADLSDLDAAARIELPTSTVAANRPGEATIRAAPDSRTGATVVGSPEAATAAMPPRKKSLSLPIIVGGLAVLFIAGVAGAAAVAGGWAASAKTTETPSATSTTAPTATRPPAGPPTVDPALVAATQLAGTLAALQATPTSTPTPNLTATYIACVFDANVVAQQPEENALIAVKSPEPVTLEIENSGTCAWDDQTVIVFASGDEIYAPDSASVAVPPAKPGDKVNVTLSIVLPQAKSYSAAWQIKLQNGREVGAPITLNYKGLVLATAAPRATATFTPAPASPTPAGGGQLGSNATIQFCEYVSGTTDYRCWITISTRGGTPPYNVIVDGNPQWSGTSAPDKDYAFFRPERRCNNMIFTWRVTDSASQTASFSGFFDPLANKKFNNNTEVCGLG